MTLRDSLERYVEGLMTQATYDAAELNDYVPLAPDAVIKSLQAILKDDPDFLTTREEIDALTDPETTIIGSSHQPDLHPGALYRRVRDEYADGPGEVWHDADNDYTVDSYDIKLPARVIFRPDHQAVLENEAKGADAEPATEPDPAQQSNCSHHWIPKWSGRECRHCGAWDCA